MAEYTPTTEDVRERFIDGAMVTGFARSRNKARRGFDRWLAEVKAEALREAADEDCAPDCEERAACVKVGDLGHSMCGRCEHGEPRHHGEHFRCAAVRPSGQEGL